MVVLAMQYSDTRYGGTHSACAARINIEAPALEAGVGGGGGGGSCTNLAVVTSYQHLLLSSSILQPQVGSGGT